MARRIAETPILYGEDAVRFLNEMGNVKPASYDEKKRVREAYEMLKNIATFRLYLEFVYIISLTLQVQCLNLSIA